MTEVLTQAEIDQLLTAINAGDRTGNGFESIDAFECLRAIRNDVSIMDLEEKPTLITNIIQYTPFNLIMNFIDGTNVEKGDLLFDEWKATS